MSNNVEIGMTQMSATSYQLKYTPAKFILISTCTTGDSNFYFKVINTWTRLSTDPITLFISYKN